jgi:integrase
MSLQTAVYRRKAIFVFRLRVPARLAPLIGRKFLKRSLRTSNPATARLRGARLLRLARELFQRIERRRNMLKRNEIEEMIRGFYAVRFEEWRLGRYAENPTIDELVAQDDEWSELAGLLEVRGHELETGLWHPANTLIPEFKNLFGIEMAPGSRDENLLREYLMRALRQLVADQIAVLDRHDYDVAEALDPLFRRPLPDPATVGRRRHHPAPPVPVPTAEQIDRPGTASAPLTDLAQLPGSGDDTARGIFGEALSAALAAGRIARMPAEPKLRRAHFPAITAISEKALWTIPELFSQFFERKQKAERGAKTLNDYKRSLAAFVEIAGLMPVGAYDVSHVEEFVNILQKTPARHRIILKTSSYRLATEMNEAASDGAKLKTMSIGVINHKYLTNVANFFRWAKTRQMIENNPTTDMQIEGPRGAAQRPRRPFTTAELQAIFRAPIFSGCKSPSNFNTPGTHLLRNRYFWVPLLALFSGCRLNELGQLRRAHVVPDENDPARWWLQITTQADPEDIEDAELLKLKSAAGERRVPLHPFLISLGFLDYVASLPEATDRRVFPDWKIGADGYYSSLFSKWFNERYLGTQLEMKKPDISFHSLRHNYKDALRRARVDDVVQDRLLGHAPQHVGRKYGTANLLTEEVIILDNIAYPGLDLSHLMPFRAATMPAPLSQAAE